MTHGSEPETHKYSSGEHAERLISPLSNDRDAEVNLTSLCSRLIFVRTVQDSRRQHASCLSLPLPLLHPASHQSSGLVSFSWRTSTCRFSAAFFTALCSKRPMQSSTASSVSDLRRKRRVLQAARSCSWFHTPLRTFAGSQSPSGRSLGQATTINPKPSSQSV